MGRAFRRAKACRVVAHAPALAEPMERRLLLHARHETIFPPSTDLLNEAIELPTAPLPGADTASAATPRLPDMVPVVDLEKGYVYGWEYDSKQIPGRTLLRLTAVYGNVGDGAMELRGGTVNPDGTQNVYQRVFLDGGGFTDRLAGTFTYHPQHMHTHFDDFAAYRLRPFLPGGAAGPIVASGEKISFCLLDTERFAPTLPRSPVLPHYVTCDAFQGISVGWDDVYDKSLADQWIDVTDVPDGHYWLEVAVDPENRLLESDETNNVVRVPIELAKPSQDPQVLKSEPAGQYPAPASVIDFRFDQPMDAGSFDATDDVRSFTGPGGRSLLGEITGASWPDASTLRVSFRTQSAEGAYAMTIGPGISAADDGAVMDQDRDKVPGEAIQDEYAATFNVSSRVGPDAFAYEARATAYEPINLEAGGDVFTILDGEDDAAAAVALGTNTFSFYGTTYAGADTLYVSSNGLITFGRGVSNFNNSDLSTDPPVPAIAPLWDDWRTDTGASDAVLGKFESTDGDAVPDRLVIEWSNVRRYAMDEPPAGAPAGAPVTFQAILALNTGAAPGAIIFNYANLDTGDTNANGASATVGIKGPGVDGGRRLLVSRNSGSHPYVASGRAVSIVRPAAVAGRYVFYKHSGADGGAFAADAPDDAAIAPDKTPLLPGQRATFANYTSYSRGLNGVMIDVARLPPGDLSAADFAFSVPVAPAAVTVRRGAGAGGSDRVTLVWPDGAILNQWLRVTVLATPATGLSAPDVFSFGNLVGDTGDAMAGSSRAVVNAIDLLRTHSHATAAALLTNPFDHNRDGRVNALDLGVVRVNEFRGLAFEPVSAPASPPAVPRLYTNPPALLLEDSAPAPL